MIDFSFAMQATAPTADEDLECGICGEVAVDAVAMRSCPMHRFHKACVAE